MHHYDRLGLLKPSGRTAASYRLYRDSDAGRLEQIVVLKFLGLPLRQIARLIKRERKLVEGFTAGDAEVQKGLNKMGGPGKLAARPALAIPDRSEDSDFVVEAMKAARRKGRDGL